ITSYGYWLWIVFSGWSYVSTVLGQMTYTVASLKLDSARSYVMQGASFTQGIISSIPIGGSISPEGFLLPILLLVVIIVTVVIVAVILIVIIVVIVGGVIVVVIIRVVVVIDVVSFILKLSFVIIGNPPIKAFISFSVFGTMFGHKIVRGQYLFVKSLFNSVKVILLACSITIGVSLGLGFLLGLSAFAMAAAYASRTTTTPSVISCRMAASVIADSSRNGLLPSGRDMIHNELSNSTKIDSSKGLSGGGIINLIDDEDLLMRMEILEWMIQQESQRL
nr:hypothetical protein [Tanacetum cinerariifolium]GFA19634.1 hypothetical protein [Tanacetum cinerariifolium]